MGKRRRKLISPIPRGGRRISSFAFLSERPISIGDSQVDGDSQVQFWQNLEKNASQIMIFLRHLYLWGRKVINFHYYCFI